MAEDSLRSDVGRLIDMPEKKFRKFFSNKNIGYVRGCEALITVSFNQLSDIHSQIMGTIVNNSLTPDSEEGKKYYPLLKQVLSEMMKAERKVFILREIFKERL